ncbi:AfsR/SARP family transcriptional regulator [Baekduia sp. Peel2402]|uniref:AfsR/SARP family transcriptional regulator n=1 Tax=Baekduia sp. Peel2402 TaxID=3458296 RepID=UPI00403E5F43
MGTSIRLLGPPAIVREDETEPAPAPKGQKSWGLLAYLLLSERPAARRHLAELLFADASDPLGALRWSLAQLRRALGDAATLEGDPIALTLADGVAVDVRGEGGEGELLEGLDFSASPAFEAWLVVARGRFAGRATASLREAALDALAAGDAAGAAERAARLVAVDPFDEGHHELLVRCLAAGGDRAGALAQAEACRRLFRRELGSEPSAAVRRAAEGGGAGGPGGPSSPGNPITARTRLEAGDAAVAAGAVEHGIELLRQACTEAAGCRDDALHGRTLLALGSALVHAVRGQDEEGALVLTQALAAAEAAGDRDTLVGTLRELAYTDIQAGRRTSVDERLARADRLANTDGEHAAILAVQGMNRSDSADYGGAFTALIRSVEHAERAGERRRVAFSLSLVARAHLLRDEHDEAAAALDEALAQVEAERWLAFMPFPEALRAEVDLARGDLDRAGQRLEHAFAVACDIGDPCWEGVAGRNMGLLEAARGRGDAARAWMDEARTRCNRVPDRYV